MNSLKLQDTKLIYRNLLYFYINTTRYQREKLRKQFHLQCIKKNKALGNKSKEVKCLYSENYTTLMKEIEEHTKKWKYISCWCIRKLMLLKCPYYSKKSAYSKQSLSKLQGIFHKNRKHNPKIHMKTQKTLNSWSNHNKRTKAGGIRLQTILQSYSN